MQVSFLFFIIVLFNATGCGSKAASKAPESPEATLAATQSCVYTGKFESYYEAMKVTLNFHARSDGLVLASFQGSFGSYKENSKQGAGILACESDPQNGYFCKNQDSEGPAEGIKQMIVTQIHPAGGHAILITPWSGSPIVLTSDTCTPPILPVTANIDFPLVEKSSYTVMETCHNDSNHIHQLVNISLRKHSSGKWSAVAFGTLSGFRDGWGAWGYGLECQVSDKDHRSITCENPKATDYSIAKAAVASYPEGTSDFHDYITLQLGNGTSYNGEGIAYGAYKCSSFQRGQP